MVIFYKEWKKNNEIELIKKRTRIIYEWKIIYPPPKFFMKILIFSGSEIVNIKVKVEQSLLWPGAPHKRIY